MNENTAKQFIDALEKAEKLSQSKPDLPNEYLPTYIKILDKIYHLNIDGKARVSDVAREMKSTRPSITRAMNEMENLGLITKEFSLEDKRVVYVSLTEKGTYNYMKYVDAYYKQLTKRLAHYNLSDIKNMIELIDSIYEDLMNTPIKLEEKNGK